MKLCAVIPSRNHWREVPAIVRRLRHAGLAVTIVDDGSGSPAREALARLRDPSGGVEVRRFETPQGKGGAVMAAMRAAIDAGFTHALQIDADGQHDLKALPRFLEMAARYPEAVICGRPIYDASAPLGRRIGRWVTHVWVWIETLSFRIPDSMCGFRIYPLAACARLFAHETPGSGMEFDTDILVRLFRRGVAPVFLAVKVVYPPENSSNFRMGADNFRIAAMHARLVLSMFVRLPFFLAHRPPRTAARHWARLSERGVYLGLVFCAASCRLIGRAGQRAVIAPIVLYFLLTGRVQRRASRAYLTRVLGRPPTRGEVWRHFMNFGRRAVDVFLAWTGRLPPAALLTEGGVPAELADESRGALLVVSHLGNAEVVRALAPPALRERVTVLVHTRHAANFHRIVSENAGDYAGNLIQVTEIGPETVIALGERIAAGGIVVIAGDRIPVSGPGRSVAVPFFGAPARFPEGPWVLAALLGCPVYLLHCLAEGDRYRLTIEPFAERIDLPRRDRAEALQGLAARFAARLERYCTLAPLQWYNFYDFWGTP
jgi:predicted LPLAT superfamily acyltransferase